MEISAPPPSRRPAYPVLVAVIALVLAAGLLLDAWFTVARERERLLADKRRELERGALMLAEKLDADLRTVLVALDRAEPWARQALATGQRDDGRDELLRALVGALPMVNSINVAGADGRVLASSAPLGPMASFAEAPFFLAHRDSRDPAPRIGAPSMGVLTGRQVVVVSRRLERAGAFGGTLSLAVRFDWWQERFTAMAEPGDSVTVLRDDSSVVIRHPRDDGGDRADFRRDPLFAAPWSAQRQAGFYRAESVVDGTPRSVAWQRLTALPLVLRIAHDERMALAPLGARAVRIWVQGGLSAGLVLLLGAGVVLQARRAQRDAAQLARARLAAERERERLETVLAGTDLGTWQWNIATGAVEFNARWAEMFGLAPGEVAPNVDAWQGLVHPDDWAGIDVALRAHFDGQAPLYRTEHRMRHADGGWRWTYACGRVVQRDAAGVPLLMTGMTLDVTVHRRIAEALRQEQDRLLDTQRQLQLALDAAGLAVWSHDVVTGEIRWDARAAALAGLPAVPLTLSQAQWRDWVHPEDAGAAIDALQAHLDGRSADYRALYRRRHASGEWRWVEVHGRVIERDAAGAALRVSGVHLDVTARELAAARNALQQRRFQAMADTVPGVVYRWQGRPDDRPGHVDYIAGPLERLLGVSVPAFEAGGLFALMAHGDVENAVRTACAAVADDQSFEVEGRLVGGERQLRLQAAFVGRVGDESVFHCLVTDVTHAHRQQVALQDARRVADEANRAKSVFLANMSHEIRTPLAGVIGTTELLLDTPLDEDQRMLVAMQREAGDALRVLVDDVLDLAKIEAGGIELESLPFDLPEMVRGAVRVVTPSARAKDLPVDVDIDPAVRRGVLGDHARLRQVLLNLLANAIKFTARGRVTVRLQVRSEDVRAQRLRLSVEDTGIGIDEALRTRLFQPFAQAERSVSRRFGGTGLGLAISHQLVAAMGGRITVDSRPGEGSRFHVDLALAGTTLLPPALREAGGGAVALPPPLAAPARALRVLLAEDVRTNQVVATRILTRAGHAVDLAEDGVQAVDAAMRADYDLVLMDVRMPGMDGLQATRRIRALSDPRRAGVPIIGLTAEVMREEQQGCLEAGMDDVVTKPFDPVLLLAKLANLSYGLAPAPSRPPADAGGDAPVLDVTVLDALVEVGEQDLMDQLLDAALQDLGRLAGTLDGDMESAALRGAAHAMKSVAANVGLLRLAALAARVEHAAWKGATAEALALRTDLARAVGEGLLALTRLRATLH